MAQRTPEEKAYLRHHTATVIGIVLTVLMIPVLLFNFAIMVKNGAFRQSPVNIYGFYPIVVADDSMADESSLNIHAGDLAAAVRTDNASLRENEVIAYRCHKIAHIGRITEVIKKDGKVTGFKVAGDNGSKESKHTISINDVVGRYVNRTPYYGKVVLFADSDIGAFVVIGIPLVWWLVHDILRYRRKQKLNGEKVKKNYALRIAAAVFILIIITGCFAARILAKNAGIVSHGLPHTFSSAEIMLPQPGEYLNISL